MLNLVEIDENRSIVVKLVKIHSKLTKGCRKFVEIYYLLVNNRSILVEKDQKDLKIDQNWPKIGQKQLKKWSKTG